MKYLAVTPGDPEGIGPEILIKTLEQKVIPRGFQLIVFGAREPYQKTKTLSLFEETTLNGWTRKKPLLVSIPAPKISNRKTFSTAGFQSGWAIELAARFVLEKQAHAIVTGPISKERLNLGGYAFPGHTEFLAKICGVKKVTMMLANQHLRVCLVTTHVSLYNVSRVLHRKNILLTIEQTAHFLKTQLRIKNPKIAVLGLNPHAGESGLFGNEEKTQIAPAINDAKKRLKDCIISGPHPADTFFAKNHMTPKNKRVDAVVCMYHDQALIPVKLLDFPNTVNVTLGLPIIRTSVDHGVGFDIAGKGLADPSSFQSALRMAGEFI